MPGLGTDGSASPRALLAEGGSNRRVGQGINALSPTDGGGRLVRVFAPLGVLVAGPDDRFELAPSVSRATFARGLAAFMMLGERLQKRPDPRWQAVEQAGLMEGTAYWRMAPPPVTLAQWLEGRGRPPPEAVMAFADALAEALEAFHQIGPHLDLSPETIGLAEGRPVLLYPSTDRRLFMKEAGRQSGGLRPGYSPIEQYDGLMRLQPLGAETDIHAACAVIYHLMTGREPPPWTERGGRPALVASQALGYPARFVDAINFGLRVIPEDRFSAAHLWRAALDVGRTDFSFWSPIPAEAPEALGPLTPAREVAAETPAQDAVPPTRARASAPARRRPLLVAASVLALAAAGGLVWWYGLMDRSYFASRDITIRQSPDPKAKVLGRQSRGFPLTVEPGGEHQGIPWMRITEGPFKDGFVSRRNLAPDPPPVLQPAFPKLKAATLLQDAGLYPHPAADGKPLRQLPAGTVVREAGVTADGFAEIVLDDGGVGYVAVAAFEPPAAATAASPAPALPVPAPTNAPARSPTPASSSPPPSSPASSPPSPPPSALPQTARPPAATGAPAAGPATLPSRPRPAPTSPPPSPPPAARPASPPPPPPPSPFNLTVPKYVTNPSWSALPSQDTLLDATPPALISQNLSGRITIDCLINANGVLSDCFLVSETPSGYNLRQAAQRLLPYYRMRPTDRDGLPTAGRRYKIVIRMGT